MQVEPVQIEPVDLEDVPAEVQIKLLEDAELGGRSLPFLLWNTGRLIKARLGADVEVTPKYVAGVLAPLHDRLSPECVEGLSGDFSAQLYRALHGATSSVQQTVTAAPENEPEPDTPHETELASQSETESAVSEVNIPAYLLSTDFAKDISHIGMEAHVMRRIRKYCEDHNVSQSIELYFAVLTALSNYGNYHASTLLQFGEQLRDPIELFIEGKSFIKYAKKSTGKKRGCKKSPVKQERVTPDVDSHSDVDDEGSTLEYEDDDYLNFEDIDFEALGIDPSKPTDAVPGSEAKVLMLAARYAAGVPLWHSDDRVDNTPIARFVHPKTHIPGGNMLDIEGSRRRREQNSVADSST